MRCQVCAILAQKPPQFSLFYFLFTIICPHLDVNLFHLVKFLPSISDAVPSEINRHSDNLTNAHFFRFVKSNCHTDICCLHHTSLCLASQDSPSFCLIHHKMTSENVTSIIKSQKPRLPRKDHFFCY